MTPFSYFNVLLLLHAFQLLLHDTSIFFLVFFAGFALKTRIAPHLFSKEFILSQIREVPFFLKLFKTLIFFNVCKTTFFIILKISSKLLFTFHTIPAGIYLLKVNNRNTRTRCEICSKLTIKTPERPLASFWCLYC